MTPETISQIIAQASEQDARTGQYRQQLADALEELHSLIRIDGHDPVDALHGFAREYIDMVPGLIECVRICAETAGVGDLFSPFIRTATGYFSSPSVLLARYDGLEGLMIKAYQCHRLMEEMYENNRSFRNSNLMEPEATQANLLAHHLIGEPFANELDQSILITVRQIAGSWDYYDLNLTPFVEHASDEAWQWMREYWLNLLERNGIRFSFAFRANL